MKSIHHLSLRCWCLRTCSPQFFCVKCVFCLVYLEVKLIVIYEEVVIYDERDVFTIAV